MTRTRLGRGVHSEAIYLGLLCLAKRFLTKSIVRALALPCERKRERGGRQCESTCCTTTARESRLSLPPPSMCIFRVDARRTGPEETNVKSNRRARPYAHTIRSHGVTGFKIVSRRGRVQHQRLRRQDGERDSSVYASFPFVRERQRPRRLELLPRRCPRTLVRFVQTARVRQSVVDHLPR